MSHRGPDFLFEAVTNSLEAGAREITIEYSDYSQFLDITVTDDGKGFSGNVFASGFSTKGEGRGKGLYLLKQCADSVDIKREKSLTKLSYRIKKEENDYISEVLPFIFSYVSDKASIVFIFHSKELNESVCSSDLIKEFGSLNSVKALSTLKKRFSVFDLK